MGYELVGLGKWGEGVDPSPIFCYTVEVKERGKLTMRTKIRFSGNVYRVNYLCSSFSAPSPKSQLWVIGNEYGPSHLITANSLDGAYGEYLDSLTPIPEDEVPEAYGVITLEGLTSEEQDELSLVDGYEYMPNAGGSTGIVNVGLYVWIHKVSK